MNCRRKGVVAWLSLVLLFGVLLTIACEPLFDLIIENQTTQKLNIFLYSNEKGSVSPGKQITIKNIPLTISEHRIVAKNTQGEVVFSQTLTRAQMQKLDGSNYKVVITPLESK